ncbi:recombinase RecQ [Enterococcus sp. JM4C]|uniref:RecQ family ATP-dependent DNA helicase n=1 Tax=Candidatus Enterococcus huntleyi TaxID=1857217 RepID=UPI00137A6553|nr:RecQ family ATP-dependent DNA helicase [Enterococcus sp. JM4C]KAF1298091.1 recombinase RecQ [Enterococcus sp. JM4C]
MQLEEALHHYFGYTNFRFGQKQIIANLLSNQSTLAILPTGTGKSLCYQLTGYLKEGLVVIVSPLISLMEDQVSQLQKNGEKRAIACNSLLSREEKNYVLARISSYKFIFFSPEMLVQSETILALQSAEIALFVIDEAHCVSQWGVDFRPEYRRLGDVRRQLKQPTTLALTATATPKVREDMCQVLFETAPQVVAESVNRENIALFVEQTEEKLASLRKLLPQMSGSGLIYCATRKQVEQLYQEIKTDFSVGFYHGGLTSSQRRQLQQQFSENKLSILIATNAFGMGIDKSDIRFVIHYDLPDSLENYVQEIGRAGRDQRDSQAILLYQEGDERIHHFFHQMTREERQGLEVYLQNAGGSEEFLSEIQQKWLAEIKETENKSQVLARINERQVQRSEQLQKMLGYIQTASCRRAYLLNYFAEKLTRKPATCCDLDGARYLKRPDDEKEFELSTRVKQVDWETLLLRLFKEKKTD